MTPGDDNDLERGGDDLLAAEYVLGVLSAPERSDAAHRVETDAAFAALVDAWEVHLSPLAAGYHEIAVPPAVKQAIDARLFSSRPVAGSAAQGAAPRAFAFWRGLAIVALAGLIALALWTASPWLQPSSAPPGERLVASLASDESDVRYLVVYDGDRAEIAMSHVTGDRAPERDFELWVIGGDEVLSLGVVPVGASVHMPV